MSRERLATVHLIEANPHYKGALVLYEVKVHLHPLASEALDAGVPEAWQKAITGCRTLIARYQARQAA